MSFADQAGPRLADPNHPRLKGWLQADATREIDLPLYSQITETLWIGGNPVGQAPVDAEYVINLYGGEPYQLLDGQVYMEAAFEDGGLPHFKFIDAVARSARAFSDAGVTLIHCQAGINRSAFIAGMALVMKGLPADKVVSLLRSKRDPILLANKAFLGYLTGRHELTPNGGLFA